MVEMKKSQFLNRTDGQIPSICERSQCDSQKQSSEGNAAGCARQRAESAEASADLEGVLFLYVHKFGRDLPRKSTPSEGKHKHVLKLRLQVQHYSRRMLNPHVLDTVVHNFKSNYYEVHNFDAGQPRVCI